MNNTEALIASAFQIAYDYKKFTYRDLDMWESITDYVHNYGGDKRYKIQCLATCTSFRSATVSYRGSRYSVDHDYPTNTYTVKLTH